MRIYAVVLILFAGFWFRQELFDTAFAPWIKKPFFVEWPCVLGAQRVYIQCGKLYVDAHRGEESNGLVVVPVVRFMSDQDPNEEQAPVLRIGGGPGGPNFLGSKFGKVWGRIYQDRYAEVLGGRDLIVFDQRGAGESRPLLDCSEYRVAILFEFLKGEKTLAELSDASGVPAIRRCFSRLTSAGVDTRDFGIADLIADIEDLRKTLEIPQWNLLGYSYGSKIALHLVDQYPLTVRSAILDGVYPPEMPAFEPVDGVRSVLRSLQKDCQSADWCRFSDLKVLTEFDGMTESLNRKPLVWDVSPPEMKERKTILVDGDLMLALFIRVLDDSAYRALEVIEAFEWQDLSRLNTEFPSWFLTERYALSIGAYLSVACGDPGMEASSLWKLCAEWPHQPQDKKWSKPVTSDIPVLLLSGELDSSTPVHGGRLAEKTLSRSYLFEIPDKGHGVSGDPCLKQLQKQFLDSPGTPPTHDCLSTFSGMTFFR